MLSLNYLNFLTKNRIPLLLLFFAFTFYTFFNLNSRYISSNDKEWIKGSTEHQRLLENEQKEFSGKKLTVLLSESENISEKEFYQLLEIHNFLINLSSDEVHINSIFNQLISVDFGDEESSFLELVRLDEVDDSYQLFQENKKAFSQYFVNNSVNFYIFSKTKLEIDTINTDLEYSLKCLLSSDENIEEYTLILGLIIILTILLWIFFHSISAPLIGILFIVMTSSITIYLFKNFVGDYTPHISILILSFSITFMDYIYIYYRWFVLQKKRSSFYSINRTIERTFSPILYTTIINSLGIGSLVFVDSVVLQSLGIMVIISSLVGLFFSFTLLPIIFSFINIQNPNLKSEQFASFFSRKIKQYSSKMLKYFIGVTLLLFVVSIVKIYEGEFQVFTDRSSKILKLSIDETDMNLQTLQTLQQIDELLADIGEIHSPYHTIKELFEKENREQFDLKNIDLDRYIFMMEMFGAYEKYIIDEKISFDIHLYNYEEKSKVIKILQESDIEVYIKDADTLLQSAKIETIETVLLLVLGILTVIFVIVFFMTKQIIYSIMAIIVALVPIVWLLAITVILGYPILMEMFIAIIISLAVSSDASIHLLDYYYKLDQERRFETDGVQKLFLYVESPLILGNIILALTFLLMIFVSVNSIIFIGFFSSTLILLSLFTDIFILPVVILEARKRI
jgi:hypothetical protein